MTYLLIFLVLVVQFPLFANELSDHECAAMIHDLLVTPSEVPPQSGMGLLMAILIVSGEAPHLKDRMKEAAQKIRNEDLQNHPFLSKETIFALNALKRHKTRGASNGSKL